MRKLVVTILTSLDGYVAGPGGNIMVMPLDESFSAYNLERLRTADTLLLGRSTFEGFRSYWPPVVEDPTQDDIEREISRRNTAARKVVVSDSLADDDLGGWGETELPAGPTPTTPYAASRPRTAPTSSCSAACRSGTICSARGWSMSCT